MVGKVKNFFQNVSWKLKQWKLAAGKWIAQVLEKAHLGFLLRMPNWVKAIVALLPALIILGVFTFYPIINSFLISFYRGYNSFTGEIDGYTFLGNYKVVLEEAGFRQAVLNTALIVFVSVPISILIGLGIAVALNSIKPLRGFFQSIFFLPYVTNSIAIGLVFAFMFKGNIHDINNLGLVNKVIVGLGGKPIVFLGAGATYASAMVAILVYTVWSALAFKIIVFLAGIQGIDKQYYQAAEIDGASRMKTFRRITLPLISPMILYIFITSIIGAFKTYTSIVAIVGPTGVITTGKNGQVNLKTIVFYVYDYLNLQGQVGQMSLAAAASILLFGIILIFTLIQMQVSKKRVHY